MPTKDTFKNINSTLKEIQKKYGDGSIMLLGTNSLVKAESVSSGILTLDLALGIGGIARGRVVEYYGPQMSGKTSLALFHIAECQKALPERLTAYIDMEHAFDPILAMSYGVNVNDMLFSQPSTGEEALDIAEALVRSNNVSCIVIDSVSSLVPKAEDEADMAQQSIGLQARMMSKFAPNISNNV